MALVIINGQTITPNPSDCKLGKFRITKARRAASGRMVMEIIAVKRTATLSWDMIEEGALRALLDNLDSRVFHTVSFPDPQAPDGKGTMTAYVGDVSMERWQRVGGVRYWSNVEIPLIEQ